MAKCPDCKLCLDIVYLNNKRYFHCWLCNGYFDNDLGSRVVYPVSKEAMEEQDKKTLAETT